MRAFPRLMTWLALLLAAVLVMTQTLGVVHAIKHGSSGLSLYSHNDGHELGKAESPSANHFLASIFSLHQDMSDCRLFDQASHGGGLTMAIQLAMPGVPPPLTVAIFQGEALARWAALFDARGPPLTV